MFNRWWANQMLSNPMKFNVKQYKMHKRKWPVEQRVRVRVQVKFLSWWPHHCNWKFTQTSKKVSLGSAFYSSQAKATPESTESQA